VPVFRPYSVAIFEGDNRVDPYDDLVGREAAADHAVAEVDHPELL
jgi:hypothetical protein